MALGFAKSLFRCELLFGLGTAVAPDVDNAYAPLRKHAPDQAAAMTVGGVFFAAHQRRAVAFDTGEDPLDPPLKRRRLGKPIVAHVAFVVVELLVIRLTAEQIPEKAVLDPPTAQVAADGLAVELRRVAGVGARADVDDQPDLVLLDQREERFGRMVGVPDREDRGVSLGPR